MKKIKIVSSVCIVIAIALIVFGLQYSDGDTTDTQKEDKGILVSGYTVLLEESEGFLLKAESYNNRNNLNLIITSNNNYSKLEIEWFIYDENKNSIDSGYNSFNNVSKNDKLLSNVTVDPNTAKSIVVKAVPDTTIPSDSSFLNKEEIKFETDDNDKTLTLHSKNIYNKPLSYIDGYILFYNKDKLIDTLHFFQIENITVGGDINITVNASNVGDYDNTKVFLNEIS